MRLSPFFHQLRSAYVAEIEDLSHDTDGAFVLQQRLTQRRGELEFLVHMLELSPEMVAVVLHKAFVFHTPSAMHQVLCCEPEDLPEWDSLGNAVTLAAWAQPLVGTIRAQAAGDWFMTVAAALEYLYFRPSTHHQEAGHHDNAHHDEHATHTNTRHHDHGHDFDADDERSHRNDQDHEEDSTDGLEGQGFDRKD